MPVLPRPCSDLPGKELPRYPALVRCTLPQSASCWERRRLRARRQASDHVLNLALAPWSDPVLCMEPCVPSRAGFYGIWKGAPVSKERQLKCSSKRRESQDGSRPRGRGLWPFPLRREGQSWLRKGQDTAPYDSKVLGVGEAC